MRCSFHGIMRACALVALASSQASSQRSSALPAPVVARIDSLARAQYRDRWRRRDDDRRGDGFRTAVDEQLRLRRHDSSRARGAFDGVSHRIDHQAVHGHDAPAARAAWHGAFVRSGRPLLSRARFRAGWPRAQPACNAVAARDHDVRIGAGARGRGSVFRRSGQRLGARTDVGLVANEGRRGTGYRVGVLERRVRRARCRAGARRRAAVHRVCK